MRLQNCKAFREVLPILAKTLSLAATSPKHNTIIGPAIEPINSFFLQGLSLLNWSLIPSLNKNHNLPNPKPLPYITFPLSSVTSIFSSC